MNLTELASEYLESRVTSLLDVAGVTGFFIEAAKEYGGWAQFEAHKNLDEAQGDVLPAIDGAFQITLSEWAVIKPLAYLFCEKETALIHELSRVASHEAAGRASSEIEGDISNFRNEYFRQWAFSYPCSSI